MKNIKFLKKLGALLVAGIVAASTIMIPTEVYAASKSRVTKSVSVAKDTKLTASQAPTLIIELEDDLAVGEVFYLELKNAEWLLDDISVVASNFDGSVTFDVGTVDATTISIAVEAVEDEAGGTLTALPADSIIRVGLASTIKKATASVVIDGDGTVITSNSGIEYAKVNMNGATAKISEVKSLTTETVIGDIMIEEAFDGAFAAELNKSGNFVMTLKLDNSDVEYGSLKKISVAGTKGLLGVTGTVRQTDDDELTITVKGSDLDGLTKGGFKISGIEVAVVDEPTSGSVNIDIESDSFKTVSLQVAKLVKQGLDIKVTPYSSDNKSGLVAGRSGVYKLEITEATEDLLLDGKKLDFALENGYFLDAGTTNAKTALSVLDGEITLPAELELDSVVLDDTKVTGFTVVVTADETEIDEYVVKLPAAVALDTIEDILFDETEAEETTSDKGSTNATFAGGEKDKKIPELKLTVSGKALAGDSIETKLADVIKPVTIALEEKVYKVGLKDQEGTDIEIVEENAGMIQRGTIVIAFDDTQGMSFTKAPTVEVTSGDLKLGKGELIRSGNSITGIKFNVTKESKSASTITIKNVVVTADRTVPEGQVGLLFGGSAITEGKSVASKLYAKLTDKNLTDSSTDTTLQDQINQILGNQATPLTAVFTMNSATYTVNGETKQMDGTPYVSTAGRTMIPVRYVADALGIDPNKILSNSGIVTILSDNGTIQFKNGSNIMLKDGAQIPMDEKTTITNGRTYIPVSFAATALNVTAEYNSATKTVTFKNKAAQAQTPVTLPATTTPGTSTTTEAQENPLSGLFDSIQ